MSGTPKDIERLYVDKLKSSGLTVADGKKLGFRMVMKPQELEEHFSNTPAFMLPYPGSKFYRIRYLQDTRRGLMKDTAAKPRRYDQPTGAPPELYMPPLIPAKSWKDLLANAKLPIIFTEGELKAACAVKIGLPTIALGGVWNFKSKGNGWFRLPQLEQAEWQGRPVFIIFDSDAATNPQVLFAQHKFGEELCHMGANPKVVNIPADKDVKYGIDDYIVAFGAKKFKELLADEASHVEFNFVRELYRLNSEIALVHKPVAIVHFNTGQLLNRQDAQTLYANARMYDKKIIPAKKGEEEDTVKTIEVQTFDKWLAWENRGEVFAPTYQPGGDRFVEDEDGNRCYNTWPGWGAEPKKGDVRLWKWLLDQVFKNAKPEHRKWFEQWCAYPIQNPGVKMFTCPILFGHKKGTGKSLVGLSVASIYGIKKNALEITNDDLEDTRNVWAAEKQFILANEITGNDKRASISRIRNLITQHSITVNKKYVPDYHVTDVINYLFTSNFLDAVYMEDDERRFFVHEVLGPMLIELDAEKVQAYDRWLRSGECGSALHWHLLNEVDCASFDPFAPAPETEGKRVMVEANRTELENWCVKLKEDPDTCLRASGKIVPFKLYRMKDLMDFYMSDGSGNRPSEKAMSNAMRKAGFEKAAKGESCPTVNGKVNLWMVRGAVDMAPITAGKMYDKERELAAPLKKFQKGAKK